VFAGGERARGRLRDSRPAAGCPPIEQLLDPAQRAAQGPRIGASPPQRQRGLKLGGYRVGCSCSGIAAISWRSMMLGDTRQPTDHPKFSKFRAWGVVA
jgi:hypothetical protein